jgi:hypothetical protein
MPMAMVDPLFNHRFAAKETTSTCHHPFRVSAIPGRFGSVQAGEYVYRD